MELFMPSLTSTKFIGSVLCVSLLVGCGSSKQEETTTTTTTTTPTAPETLNTLLVKPSLGKIKNARVILKNAKTLAKIDELNTLDAGEVTFSFSKNITSVLVEVIAGENTSYFDEVTSTDSSGIITYRAIPKDTVIFRSAANIVVVNSEIGVSALTEAAVKRSEKLAQDKGGQFIDYFPEAKALIEVVFDIPNILKPPVIVADSKELSLLNIAEQQYGDLYALRLAGLAKLASVTLGNSELMPALMISKALAEDLKDGNIDGSGNISTLPYTPSTMSADYQTQTSILLNDLLRVADLPQNQYDKNRIGIAQTFIQNNPLVVNISPNNCSTQPDQPQLLVTGVSSLCHFKLKSTLSEREVRVGTTEFQFNNTLGGRLFITTDNQFNQVKSVSFYPLNATEAFSCANTVNSSFQCDGISVEGEEGNRVFKFSSQTKLKKLSTAEVINTSGTITSNYGLLCRYFTTVPLSNLTNIYNGGYSVELYSVDTSGIVTVEQNSTLSLSSDGVMTLGDVSKNISAVCQASTSELRAVIDNNPDKYMSFAINNNNRTIGGVDFSHPNKVWFVRNKN